MRGAVSYVNHRICLLWQWLVIGFRAFDQHSAQALALVFERFYFSFEYCEPLALSFGNVRACFRPFDQQHAIGKAANFLQAKAGSYQTLDLLDLGNGHCLEGAITVLGSCRGQQTLLIIVTN